MNLFAEIFPKLGHGKSKKTDFMFPHGFKSHFCEKSERGSETEDTRDMGRAGFKTSRTRLVLAWLGAGVQDHTATEDGRAALREEYFLTKENAYSRWAIHLVRRKGHEVSVPLDYAYGQVSGLLRRIHDDERSRIFGAYFLNDGGYGIEGAKDIGERREGDDFGLRIYEGKKGVNINGACRGEGGAAEGDVFGAGEFNPGEIIGMVFELGSDDMVSWREEGSEERSGQIE